MLTPIMGEPNRSCGQPTSQTPRAIWERMFSTNSMGVLDDCREVVSLIAGTSIPEATSVNPDSDRKF